MKLKNHETDTLTSEQHRSLRKLAQQKPRLRKRLSQIKTSADLRQYCLKGSLSVIQQSLKDFRRIVRSQEVFGYPVSQELLKVISVFEAAERKIKQGEAAANEDLLSPLIAALSEADLEADDEPPQRRRAPAEAEDDTLPDKTESAPRKRLNAPQANG